VRRINAALFIGHGKVEEVRGRAEDARADVVIFDEPLSPAQQRNLERALDRKVIDRSALILDIFAQRARSLEGKMQVELAQLQYLLPRLTRLWEHLSRLGGGIGTRGPGETQLEVDRRRVRERIAKLRRELERVVRERRVQRRGRRDCFKISLVGYTNAGISTLFNKIDALPDEVTMIGLRARFPGAVFLSATTREGFPDLRASTMRYLVDSGARDAR